MPGTGQRRKIGFQTSYDEVEPIKEITNEPAEEKEEEKPAMLGDYIPDAIYDGAGNIVTYKSFKAKVQKTKAEAKNLTWTALAKLILYSGLSISVLLLSYGVYKKYLQESSKPKIEIINNRQKQK